MMQPSSYTIAENWGFQINFMVPLDKSGLEQCRRIAKRQEEKMQLDYELVRALKCAQLQRQGFIIFSLLLSTFSSSFRVLLVVFRRFCHILSSLQVKDLQ